YFKETAIPLAWELVTDPVKGFGLTRERLRVTTHPTDEEAREIWRRQTDVNPDWIYEKEDNWWALELGPCGPDSEIWWDRGLDYGCGQPDCQPDHCDRFLEFWNLVFPQFDKQPDGSLLDLPRQAIDTGMGLERISSIIQGVPSIFDIDLFAPLMRFVRDSSPALTLLSDRVISEPAGAAPLGAADGVAPATEGRGYVLRRVTRRAALHARRAGMSRPLADGVPMVVATMRDQYQYLAQHEPDAREAIAAEQDAFNR